MLLAQRYCDPGVTLAVKSARCKNQGGTHLQPRNRVRAPRADRAAAEVALRGVLHHGPASRPRCALAQPPPARHAIDIDSDGDGDGDGDGDNTRPTRLGSGATHSVL